MAKKPNTSAKQVAKTPTPSKAAKKKPVATKAAPAKPAPKASPKPVAKPTTKKVSAKADKKAGKVTAPKVRKPAKAVQEDVNAGLEVQSKAKATQPAKDKPAKDKPVKEKAARVRAAVERDSARPAPKPHVHAAGETSERPSGRGRAAVGAGPVHGGVGDDAVRNATGRGWDEWLALLDGEGATAMEHKAIAELLHTKHGVPEWWSQTVTTGYEQARGLRQKYETPDGFQAGMSKTINAPVSKLYQAWADEAIRERWLGEVEIEVRVANVDRNIRMTWLGKGPDEGSSVEVQFIAKDASRGMVKVDQRKLKDADAVQRVKAFWSVKLENLRAAMEK